MLFRGYDEISSYCELWPPHAYEALVNNEDANEADSVHEMATLWSGSEGHWVVYEGGSEVPDLSLGCNFNSRLTSVLFKRPFSMFAFAWEMGEDGLCEYMQPIPIFPTGVQVVQMDAETLELEKDRVGSSIGLKGEAQDNWELQMSHNDVYFFPHRVYNAKGKWTRWSNLDVKGTEVKVLSDLVPMFSASGCTTLFVHACTTNVQFE